MFEHQVEKSPEAIALVFNNQRVSYRELNERANQLARYLQNLGVGNDILVGVCLERSIDMIVALLAVLKVGGAYLPLDPSYPQARLVQMIVDSGSAVVLTEQAFTRLFGVTDSILVVLDIDRIKFAAARDTNLDVATSSDNLAYVLYTSGSTGIPKGVAVAHRSTMAFVAWAHSAFSRTDFNGVLAATSICFDLSVFEIFATLTIGGKVVIAQNALALADLPAAAEVTLINTVPSAIAQLLKLHAVPPSVRVINLAGEPLPTDLVNQIYDSCEAVRVYDLYGPTECTTYSTWTMRQADERPTIGRPIANTRIFIVDANLAPVPIGVAGELHIGGDGLARGYLNRPELTAEKFIANPFSSDTNEKLYRTGDLARYRPDGNIEFLGRIDNQVKLRGFRIELGEIETVITQHPAIEQTVVLLREDTPGDKRLVAYIVTADGSAVSVHDLRAHAQQKLPDYMVPAYFVVLDSLPLTTNGKIDRKALPAPIGQSLSAARQYVAPRDSYETALCDLWSEALHIDQVGIDDDFFALGGHSLLAAKLFARMDEELGRSLPLSVLFAAPNIRALAEHYRASTAAHKIRSLVALRSKGNRPPLFAVPGVYGNVLGYADLAQALGPDQPFYGLQSIGLDGSEAPLDSIAAMARLYIEELRSVQPNGPYALMGACFGATVAYEMTQQLLQAGESVTILALLDPTGREGRNLDDGTSSSRTFKMAGALTDLVTGRLHLYLDELCQLNNRERIRFIATKLRGVGRSLAQRNRLKGVQRELHQIAVYKANLLALDRYKKTPLTGALPTVEIFATEGRLQVEHWSSLCPGPLAFHKVPGKDSGDMMSAKNSRKLALLLALRLTAAFAGNHQSQTASVRPATDGAELANPQSHR